MKTSELTGDTLVWAVAICEGYTDLHKIEGRRPHEPHLAMMPPRREYGAMELWEIGSDCDWRFFGPIIEREGIGLLKVENRLPHQQWDAGKTDEPPDTLWAVVSGPTPLIAAMRCYVMGKLGGEIDVPEELK